MSPVEYVEYYVNLLILQYHEKPKAKATIAAQVAPVFMDNLPIQVQDAFNLLTQPEQQIAAGVQLDVLGKYIGVSRVNYTQTGPVTLSDADYLTLMRLVIIKNNSGSSLATIQELLAQNFPGQIYVSDNQAMGLNYVLLDSLGTPELLEVLVFGGYLPTPMAVETSVVVVPDLEFPFFGLRTYVAPNPNASPLNNYAFYQLTYPWLSYSEVS